MAGDDCDSPSVASSGWLRCHGIGLRTWRRGRGEAARCTCGAGTASTPHRWRGSTAGSATSTPNGYAHRVARHPGVVRCDRPAEPRSRWTSVAARLIGAARCDGHCGVAVGTARGRIPVRLARLVRPGRRAGPPHRVGRAHHPGDRERGPVHRGPVEAGDDRVDRHHDRRARRVDATDLYSGLRRRRRHDLRPARRRHRPCVPVPVRMEGRPRTPTQARGPSPTGNVRRARRNPIMSSAAAPTNSTTRSANSETNSTVTNAD